VNCNEVRVLLDDYLGGRTGFRESMNLEIHLAVCEQCYNECNEMEKVYALVNTAFAHQPLPHDFAWRVCDDLPTIVEPEDIDEEREIVTTGFLGLINVLTFARARRRLFGRHSAWGRFRRRVLRWFVGSSYDTFGEWGKDFAKRFATSHPWTIVLLLLVLIAGVVGVIGRSIGNLEPKVGVVLDLTGDGRATKNAPQKKGIRDLKRGSSVRRLDMVMTDEAVELTIGCAADGTLVHMRSRTTITFLRPRWLRVTAGEVLLDVMERSEGTGAAQPFTVSTNHGTTLVYGTVFSVRTSDESTVIVVEKGYVLALPESGTRSEQRVKNGQCYQFGGEFVIGPQPAGFLNVVWPPKPPRVKKWRDKMIEDLIPSEEVKAPLPVIEDEERPIDQSEEQSVEILASVLDESGKPIRGVTVTMRWRPTSEELSEMLRNGVTPNTSFTIKSKRDGTIDRKGLPAGMYSIEFAHPNYHTVRVRSIALTVPNTVNQLPPITLQSISEQPLSAQLADVRKSPASPDTLIVDIAQAPVVPAQPPVAAAQPPVAPVQLPVPPGRLVRPRAEIVEIEKFTRTTAGTNDTIVVKNVEAVPVRPENPFCSVGGIVVDESSVPVPNTIVSLSSAQGKLAENTTDERGWYVFAELPPGSYRVTASAEGYESLPIPVVMSKMGTSLPNVTLTLTRPPVSEQAFVDIGEGLDRPEPADRLVGPDDATAPAVPEAPHYGLAGIVMDSHGRSIAQATVSVERLDGLSSEIAPSGGSTRIDGSFRIAGLVAGRYRVSASAAQFVTATQEVNVPTSEAISLFVEPRDMIRGIVTDSSGRPISNALVSIIGAKPQSSMVLMLQRGTGGGTSTHTQIDGSFRFSAVPAGTYELTVKTSGFATAYIDGVFNGETDLNVTVREGGVLEGEVVAPAGVAASGMYVAAVCEAPGTAGYILQRVAAVVGPDGRFRLPNLMMGEFTVRVAQVGGMVRATERVVMTESGQTVRRKFKLATTDAVTPRRPTPQQREYVSTMSGIIRDVNEQPVGGARVCLFSVMDDGSVQEDWTATNEFGEYGTGRPAGAKRCLLVAMAAEFAPALVEVGMGEPGAMSEENVVLQRGGAVRGVVTDNQDNPVQGAGVTCAYDRSYPPRVGEVLSKHTFTDESGRYEILGLMQGSYIITASAGDRGHDSEVVYFSQETEQMVAMNLSISSGSMRLAGTALDGAGRPVVGATVRAVGEHLLLTGSTDSSGRFTFSGLGDREVTLALSHPQLGIAVSENVTVGSEDVIVRLGWGGLSGRVMLAGSGTPVSQFTVFLFPPARAAQLTDQQPQRRTFDSADGRFSVTPLMPGMHDLVVTAPGVAPLVMRGLDVPTGETRNVGRLSMQVGGLVAGSVGERGTGTALGGAVIRLVPVGGRDAVSEEMVRGIESVATGADGRFEIDRVPRGDYYVVASLNGYAEASSDVVAVSDGSQTDVDRVLLGKGGAISGWLLLDGGIPAKGVQLTLVSNGLEETAETEADGRFTVLKIAEAEWALTADLQGTSLMVGTVHVREGVTTPAELRLQTAGTIGM